MWQQLNVRDNCFLIKKVRSGENYNVLVSDLVNIWGEELTELNIYQRCKKLNPLMEGEQESLTKWILSLFDNDSAAKINMLECDDSKIMEIRSKLSGVPFIFKFYLDLKTPEKFYNEMTLPLIFMIQQLQVQKQQLFHLLKKKDIEISEYKMEGIQLSSKNLVTPTFAEDQFEESCSAISIPTYAVEKPALLFTPEIQNLYAGVLHKYDVAKALNEAAKEETDTEDSGTQSTQSDSSPEKKKKIDEGHKKQEVSPTPAVRTQTQNDNQDRTEDKQIQEKLLAKQRKQVMKRKLLKL